MQGEISSKDALIKKLTEKVSQSNQNDFEKEATKSHAKKIEDLETQIALKDDEIAQLKQSKVSLEQEWKEKIKKSEKAAEERSEKLQEDFLKEYELVVKEKEQEGKKAKDTATRITKLEKEYEALIQSKNLADERNKELQDKVTALTQQLQSSDEK